MIAEVISLNLFAFLLVFVRMSGFFLIAPGLSAANVSTRIRLLFALTFAFMILPVVIDKLPTIPGHPAQLGALILAETAIGLFIGFTARIIFSAVEIAGTISSFVSSLANAMVLDPISRQQSAILSGFMSVAATLLLFVTNLHHMMLQAMIDSFDLFPPGQILPVGDMSEVIARSVTGAMTLGVQLSAPIIIISFAYYLGLGLLTRLEPQVPIFFVGMPLQILLGLGTFMVSVSAILLFFLSRFEESFQPFLSP